MNEGTDLFAQQEANRRRSSWLVVGFIIFFAWVGFGGDLAFGLLTADAPPGALTLSRVRQVSKPHWKRPEKKS